MGLRIKYITFSLTSVLLTLCGRHVIGNFVIQLCNNSQHWGNYYEIDNQLSLCLT